MRAQCLGLVAVSLVTTTAHADDRLDEARKAMAELRYEDARARLDARLRDGHLARRDLIELYELRGELACVVDGPESGEREFRKLLVLDPIHAAPADPSPVLRVPFVRARAWVSKNGALRVEHTPPPFARAAGTPSAVRVAADPLAMVTGVAVHVRAAGQDGFVELPQHTLIHDLPPARAGAALDYYVDVLDSSGNTVFELGSASQPFHLVAKDSDAQPRGHRLRRGALVAASISVVVLGTAIGFDAAARAKFDDLEVSCGPSCSQDQLAGLHTEERVAGAAYVTAGAATLTAIALYVIGRVRR